MVSDEGNTYMHLTYDLDEKDFQSGTRAKIISNTLSLYSIEDRRGELVLPVRDEAFGDALFDYVQALGRIANVTFLSRERVRSTFLQDLRALVVDRVAADARVIDWHDPERDPLANYPVDYRIEGARKPIFVFGLPSEDKVRDVTIYLHQFERWSIRSLSIGVFEDQEQVARKVLARFSDIVDKQFSTLRGNEDRILDYIAVERNAVS